jgi:hypothetical protein
MKIKPTNLSDLSLKKQVKIGFNTFSQDSTDSHRLNNVLELFINQF